MITVNLVPPERLQTQEKKNSKSTVLVQKWPQVYFSTVEIHPAGEEYFFTARHFFGNLALLDLALTLHVPAQPTRWLKEATMSECTLVRECGVVITTFISYD